MPRRERGHLRVREPVNIDLFNCIFFEMSQTSNLKWLYSCLCLAMLRVANAAPTPSPTPWPVVFPDRSDIPVYTCAKNIIRQGHTNAELDCGNGAKARLMFGASNSLASVRAVGERADIQLTREGPLGDTEWTGIERASWLVLDEGMLTGGRVASSVELVVTMGEATNGRWSPLFTCFSFDPAVGDDGRMRDALTPDPTKPPGYAPRDGWLSISSTAVGGPLKLIVWADASVDAAVNCPPDTLHPTPRSALSAVGQTRLVPGQKYHVFLTVRAYDTMDGLSGSVQLYVNGRLEASVFVSDCFTLNHLHDRSCVVNRSPFKADGYNALTVHALNVYYDWTPPHSWLQQRALAPLTALDTQLTALSTGACFCAKRCIVATSDECLAGYACPDGEKRGGWMPSWYAAARQCPRDLNDRIIRDATRLKRGDILFTELSVGGGTFGDARRVYIEAYVVPPPADAPADEQYVAVNLKGLVFTYYFDSKFPITRDIILAVNETFLIGDHNEMYSTRVDVHVPNFRYTGQVQFKLESSLNGELIDSFYYDRNKFAGVALCAQDYAPPDAALRPHAELADMNNNAANWRLALRSPGSINHRC